MVQLHLGQYFAYSRDLESYNVMATPVTIWAISQSTGHLNFRSACHGAHHGMRYCKEYLDISLLET